MAITLSPFVIALARFYSYQYGILTWFALLSTILVTGCQSIAKPVDVTAIPGATGWSAGQVIAQLTEPVFQPAVVFSNGQPIAGWWSHVTNSNTSQLSLSILTNTPTIQSIALGQTPDHLLLFASPYGLLVIWRDQNAASADSTDRRLYAALLNPDLTLARSPVQITNQSTDSYAAALLPSGDIAIAWTGHTGVVADSLSLSALGAGGTVFPAQAIAVNVAHPALTVTPDGQLIAGWLSPQPGSTWAIQKAVIQTTLDSTHKITFQSGAIDTVGFLQPGGNNNSQVVDSFKLGSDAAGCGAFWSTSPIHADSVGNLSALTFPCTSVGTISAEIRQTRLIDSGRWPITIPLSQNSPADIPIGLTITDPGGDIPAVIQVHNGQVTRMDKLASPVPLTTVGSLALAADPANGRLIAVWSQINPNGTATLNFEQQIP